MIDAMPIVVCQASGISETVWLFLVGQAIAFLSAGVAAHFWQLNLSRENSERISKIEGFIDGLGQDYARRLHRDDDKFGVDKLLERYIERHHELTAPEWVELHEACERILKRKDVTDFEITGYTFLKNLCEHKARAFIEEHKREKGEQP